MNIRRYFISTEERLEYTTFFKFKSAEVKLLSNGEFVGMIGQIRLSIKLFVNGQFKLYKILPT